MSARLETAAEILKLERLLSLEHGTLEFLGEVAPSEIRTLREKATDSLFDTGAKSMARLAAAAAITPSALVATIAEKSFGPLMCARAAAAVDPAKAIDVAKRLSPDFLADATIELDPRRVARIIAGVPTELVEPVARELGRRKEHVTMGRFLAFVPDHSIVAAMTALSDEAMLRTAFVLEHKEALDHAVGLLPPERLPGVLRIASEQGLWAEALDLLDHLSHERRGPIADVVGSMEEDVVAELVRAVSAADLWEALLPVVSVMSEQGRLQIAGRPAFHEPRILEEIVGSAARDGRLWPDLLPLVVALPGVVRAKAADLIARQDPHAVVDLITAAHGHALWPLLLPVLTELDEESRAHMVGVIDAADPDLVSAVAHLREDPDLTDLLPLVPTDIMSAVDRAVAR
ncbi:hypothetical protein F0U44_04765 [Nocardioides humilatus]|uniref:Uncharacterized protein n=1 Tax=Nocardioides humilatus TaxID=2607660 RepID=A0A5B1LM93_9ACTN|nr:hypothetical protein [Nocardioides humilatus]KAA1421596.1 hypothetical protein F0U44_04765 [Nocardioides humilatus]